MLFHMNQEWRWICEHVMTCTDSVHKSPERKCTKASLQYNTSEILMCQRRIKRTRTVLSKSQSRKMSLRSPHSMASASASAAAASTVSLTAVRSSVRGAIIFACYYPPRSVTACGVESRDIIEAESVRKREGQQVQSMICTRVASKAIPCQEISCELATSYERYERTWAWGRHDPTLSIVESLTLRAPTTPPRGCSSLNRQHSR